MIGKDKSGSGTPHKTCRSCMNQVGEGVEMRNLFDTSTEGPALCLAEMMMACASVQIMTGDGLPELLCLICQSKLNMAFEFKVQCEQSDVALRQLTTNQNCPMIEEVVVRVESDIAEVFNDDEGNVCDTESEEDVKKPKRVESAGSYSCEFCDRVLASKKGLKIHQRRHTGDKLQKCEVCKAKFTRTNHLRRHLQNCHIVKSETTPANDKGPEAASKEEAEMLGNGDELFPDADADNSDEGFHPNITEVILEESETNEEEEVKSTKRKYTRKKRLRKQKEEKYTKLKSPTECEFCDRKFKYRKSFIHHMQTEHGMSDESDVPLSAYITKPHLKEEASDSTNITKPDGDISEETKPMALFLEEQEAVDKSQPQESSPVHSCHVCQASFNRVNHLTRHMTLHRALLVHKCSRCDKAFATEDHLARHTDQDHVDRPYICALCNKVFTRGEHLIRHLRVVHIEEGTELERILKCSICEKTFSRSDHLARHIKIHLQQDKRHVCSQCGKAFNRLDNLKTHQRIHAGVKETSKLHLCIYCGKEFNNSSNMIVHMRRHTGERPYKCSQCGKGFPRSHDLKCHERTHSGEKPYLCTLCGKCFNKSNKLLRHTRVHTGERPYVCNLCNRAFTQSNDLALHMRRHTGSRPYACGMCPARFIQSGQLKAHRRTAGHWIETQPDLKGGHRVEPIASITEPQPIKFRLPGKYGTTKSKPKLEVELREVEVDDPEPRLLVSNIIPAVSQTSYPSLIIESSKLLEQIQIQHAGLVGFTSVINAAHTVQIVHEEKDSTQKDIPTSSYEASDTFSQSSATYTSPDRYNYQNYG